MSSVCLSRGVCRVAPGRVFKKWWMRLLVGIREFFIIEDLIHGTVDGQHGVAFVAILVVLPMLELLWPSATHVSKVTKTILAPIKYENAEAPHRQLFCPTSHISMGNLEGLVLPNANNEDVAGAVASVDDHDILLIELWQEFLR